MEESEKMTQRRYLKGHNAGRLQIDMEEVYRKLDQGMTLNAVARELGVSRSTLYHRHNEYQAYIAAINAGSDYFADYEDGE